MSKVGLYFLRLLSDVVGHAILDLVSGGEEQPREIQTSLDASATRNQLGAAFRSFLNVVSAGVAPVVILLDDLQWADASSVELLKALVSGESSSSGLLLIGCYRSNEVSEGHILARAIRDLEEEEKPQQSEESSSFSSSWLTKIEVGNLCVDSVKEMLCELLSKDPCKEVDQLAALCHGRTQGNVFFVKAFLSMLVDELLLKFHVGTFQWDFNVSLIESNTAATPNLVDLIHARMSKMQEEAVGLLKLAACLGHRFDQSTLRLVWEHLKEISEDDEEDGTIGDFDALLRIAIGESCLEVAGFVSLGDRRSDKGAEFVLQDQSGSLRFVHDKIQEAVISLIPPEAFVQLQHRVGTILCAHLKPNKAEAQIFVIASLLNGDTTLKNPEIAALNLRAALKAKDLAAFSSTVYFAQHGLIHLPPDEMWTTHFDLAIQLYSLCALGEYSLGNEKEANEYCSIIIGQEKATPLQKCQAYKVRFDLIHNTSQQKQSFELALDHLEALGCKIPRRKIFRQAMVSSYVRETKQKYIPTKEEVANMPMISEPVILEVLQFLERAGSLAYVLAEMDLYVLCRCRFIRYIKEYGLTDDAASAFSSFGNVLFHKYGDSDTAVQLAELSLSTQELLQSKYYAPRTWQAAHGYVLGFTTPLRSRLKFFLEVYELGMQSGNIFSGSSGLMFYLLGAFVAGVKLGLQEEDLGIYLPQLDRLKIGVAAGLNRPVQQLVENLRATGAANTTLLTGSFMDEE